MTTTSVYPGLYDNFYDFASFHGHKLDGHPTDAQLLIDPSTPNIDNDSSIMALLSDAVRELQHYVGVAGETGPSHEHRIAVAEAVLAMLGSASTHPASDFDATGSAGAVQSNLNSHSAASTNVHGIPDTSALVVTSDSRLTNARTPTAHHGSHDTGGSDPLAHMDASVLDTGVLGNARVPTLDALRTPVAAVGMSGQKITGLADGVNPQDAATIANVAAQVSAVIGAAPGSLDTLKELADAINDDASFAATVVTALSGKQPIDAKLTAISGLAGTADTFPYFTGAGAASAATVTTFARSFLDDTDATTVRATLGAASSARSIATGAGLGGGGDLTADRTIAITDVELLALMGLTSAADTFPYFTGSGAASLATVTTFARTILDDTNAATARATLGVGPAPNRVSMANANLTGTATDLYVVGGALTADRTLTLPAASAWPKGYPYFVGDDVGAITASRRIAVAPAGSDTIVGQTTGFGTAVIDDAFGFGIFYTNGVDTWYWVPFFSQADVNKIPQLQAADPTEITLSTAGTPPVTSIALTSSIQRAPALFARLTADTTAVNASTTMINAGGLAVTLAANSVYKIEAFIIYRSSIAADMALGFTFPTGMTGWWVTRGVQLGLTPAATVEGLMRFNTFSGPAGPAAVGGGGATTDLACTPIGVFVTDATHAGTLQLQFTQQNSDATDTKIRAFSWLMATKVA